MKIALAGILASTAALAQPLGDWHNATAMQTPPTLMKIVMTALFIGLAVLVWLWNAKLWKELRRKK